MRQCFLIPPDALPAAGVFGRDIPLSAYRKHLGTERGDTYIDASNGLYPNAFTAIAGTLKRGANLYLHLPSHYPNGDPDHLRLLDYGIDPSGCKNHYNTRFKTLIAASQSISFANSALDRQHQPTAAANSQKRQAADCRNVLLPQSPNFTSSGIALILGGRGRGKSTLLAAKSRWLTDNGIAPLLIVSPFIANRSIVSRQLPADAITLPPDEALRLKPAAAHLIIDEAAALPPTQLFALIDTYPDCTLATTAEGYEGSANTFRTRTLPLLKERSATLIELEKAHRFDADDALENLIHTLNCSAANTPQANIASTFAAQRINAASIRITAANPNALIYDEPRLQALWHLLSEAHYRTRPEDIKRLLDLPNQRLYCLEHQGAILATAIVLIEPPLPPELIQDVISGKRRPRGRLLMQQLLAATQNSDYAAQSIARIQRIATAERFRRQGLASQLIEGIIQNCAMPIGTVHTAAPAIDAFWQHTGFAAIKHGQHRSRHLGASAIRLFQKNQLSS